MLTLFLRPDRTVAVLATADADRAAGRGHPAVRPAWVQAGPTPIAHHSGTNRHHFWQHPFFPADRGPIMKVMTESINFAALVDALPDPVIVVDTDVRLH